MVTYPKDWNLTTVEKIAHIGTGCRDTQDNVKGGKYPFYVRSNTVERINVADYDCEAVLTAGDGVGTGKVFHYVNGKFAAHQRVYVIKDFSEINARFFYYFFSNNFRKEVEKYTAKSSVDSVRRAMIAEMDCPKPCLPEQKGIAETLSCIDDHITNLTELIEKKKAIRDGALEDLVSGRTRLKGFSGEWNKMSLSRFADINPRTDIPDSFMYVDLESVKGISLISQRRENKHSAPSRARRFAQKGDVFYQTVRPYQKNNYLFNLEGDYVFSTGYAQLRTKNDPDYLFLLIRQDSFVNDVLDNCTGTSYPAINPKKLSEINIYVPTDINEQRAISKIITMMDDEIGSLEEAKDKMLQIKAGAMDDLLTGRIRLARQGG